MKVYEPRQMAVYQEDGARAVVEVMERIVKGDTEMYKLRVVTPLNTSKPHFVGPQDGVNGPNEAGLDFVRGFSSGQELTVDRNLKATGNCWGMWTLTDVVENTENPIISRDGSRYF